MEKETDATVQSGKGFVLFGTIGAVVAAVCCFTPALVLVLALVGVTTLAAWVDFGLFAILAISLCSLTYGLWARAKQ
jgi:mercuric ion transport protein